MNPGFGCYICILLSDKGPLRMLDKIFDIIIGFMLNRDLEREIGVRHKLP